MDPNAPTWNPSGNPSGNPNQQSYVNYNPNVQQGQYGQQGYQYGNQYGQQAAYNTMNQQQQYMYQQSQQTYFNQNQAPNQSQNQYYNQNQYNRGYNQQNQYNQSYNQNQGYNNPNNNNNNNNNNYNPNDYNRSHYNNYDNRYNNNRNNNNRNQHSRNQYDRNQNMYNRSNVDNTNNNDVNQMRNDFASMNANPQQQPQPQQESQTQKQASSNVDNWDDSEEEAQAPPQATQVTQQASQNTQEQSGTAGGGTGAAGKKKKKRRRKKKGNESNDQQDSQAPSQPSDPTPQTSQTSVESPQSSNIDNASQSVSKDDQNETVATEETSEVVSENVIESQAASTQSTSETPVKANKNETKETKEKQKAKPKQKPKEKGKDKEKETESKTEETGASKKSKKKKSSKSSKANVDVHDSREHLNLVLVGHVDAGKSTISGQILLQTNQIDERTIAKYAKEAKERNRESWWIAYIMDEDDEERAKGKTVECGRAHFDTSSKRYTILDAPGHKNYVPNMISGASQADVALLVISARKGEFDAGFNRGGQTREHALLAYTLGISRVVIVVNKMDTCKWAAERYDDIETKVRTFLTDVGFKNKYIDCVPVSGQSGVNISSQRPITNDICDWWIKRTNGTSKTLLDTLDSLKKLKRSGGGSLRIPILDRYKGDKGLQAIGKIESGHVSVGDSVVIMPTNTNCKIAGLAIDDVNVENAVAGENILISFESQKTNLSLDNMFGGCVVCNTNDLTPLVKKFRATVALQSELPNNGIVTKGYTAVFHCHNVTVKCEIVALRHLLRKDGKKSRNPPPFLRANQSAVVDIEIDGNVVAVEEYKNFAQLGRFTLRDSGQTVAIGKIEEILNNVNGEEEKGKK